MAYETGAYTDQFDLLDKIKTFLDSGGGDGTWTVDSYIDDTQKYPSGTAESQKRLHIHKTAVDSTVMYFHLKSANAAQIWEYTYSTGAFSGIGLYGSTGYSGAGNWDKEPGYPQGSAASKSCGADIIVSSAGTYYFFSSADTIVICIEFTSGKFQWMAFGQTQKFGSFTGGQFITASNSSKNHIAAYIPGGASYPTSYSAARPFWCRSSAALSHYNNETMVYLEIDSKTNWWSDGYRADAACSTTKTRLMSSGMTDAENTDDAYNLMLASYFGTRNPNEFNGIAVFLPIYFFAERLDSKFSPLGYVDIVRLTNMRYKSPGDEISYGGDTWKIFPMYDTSTPTLSGLAFAVKKVT